MPDGTHIVLVSNRTKYNEANAARVESLVNAISADKRSVAASIRGRDRIALSIDRIVAIAEREHLDLSKEEDQKKLGEYIEKVIMHEVGRNLGLCHEDPCGSGNDRSKKELMNDQTGMASRMYRSMSRNDIDAAGRSMGIKAR